MTPAMPLPRKVLVLAALIPLAALGCENNKKTPTPTDNSLTQQPAPQPYVPPNAGSMSGNGMSGNGMSGTGMSGGITGMGDTGSGTVITPLTPESMTPPPVEKPAPRTSPNVTQRPTRSNSPSGPSMSGGTSARVGSTYTVKSGDSLSEIAAKVYGKGNVKKGVAAIKKANNLKSDTIRIGQKLKLPSL